MSEECKPDWTDIPELVRYAAEAAAFEAEIAAEIKRDKEWR